MIFAAVFSPTPLICISSSHVTLLISIGKSAVVLDVDEPEILVSIVCFLLEEAFSELDRMLQQDDKDYIVENGSIAVHHSLGRWIRNNWGLWDDEANDLKRIFTKIGISHPDDMSDHIIKWYIHHLKNDDEFYKKEIKIDMKPE